MTRSATERGHSFDYMQIHLGWLCTLLINSRLLDVAFVQYKQSEITVIKAGSAGTTHSSSWKCRLVKLNPWAAWVASYVRRELSLRFRTRRISLCARVLIVATLLFFLSTNAEILDVVTANRPSKQPLQSSNNSLYLKSSFKGTCDFFRLYVTKQYRPSILLPWSASN